MHLKQTLIFKTMTGRVMADVRSDVHGCAQRHVPPPMPENALAKLLLLSFQLLRSNLRKVATSVLLNQGDILHWPKTQ